MIKYIICFCLCLFWVSKAGFSEDLTAQTEASSYLAQGMNSLAHNDISTAIKMLLEIKKKEEHSLEAYYLGINILWKLRKYPELIAEVKSAEKHGIQRIEFYKLKIIALFLTEGFLGTLDDQDKIEILTGAQLQ